MPCRHCIWGAPPQPARQQALLRGPLGLLAFERPQVRLALPFKLCMEALGAAGITLFELVGALWLASARRGAGVTYHSSFKRPA